MEIENLEKTNENKKIYKYITRISIVVVIIALVFGLLGALGWYLIPMGETASDLVTLVSVILLIFLSRINNKLSNKSQNKSGTSVFSSVLIKLGFFLLLIAGLVFLYFMFALSKG